VMFASNFIEPIEMEEDDSEEEDENVGYSQQTSQDS